MILEVKIPHLGRNTSLKELLSNYGGKFYLHFLALLVCYLSIGNLWTRHHELYEHIINYNRRLIRVNLFFLLSIMFLPLSVSFMFEWNNPQQVKITVYFINLFLCNLTFYLMLLVVFNKKNNFSSIAGTEAALKSKHIALNVTIMFFMVVILGIVWMQFFYLPFLIWPLVTRIAERIRRARKKKKMAMVEN